MPQRVGTPPMGHLGGQWRPRAGAGALVLVSAGSLGSQALDPRHAIACAVGHPLQSHITHQWAKQSISCRTSPLGPLHALSSVHDIVGRRPDLGSRRKQTPRAAPGTDMPIPPHIVRGLKPGWLRRDDRWEGRGFKLGRSNCVWLSCQRR